MGILGADLKGLWRKMFNNSQLEALLPDHWFDLSASFRRSNRVTLSDHGKRSARPNQMERPSTRSVGGNNAASASQLRLDAFPTCHGGVLLQDGLPSPHRHAWVGVQPRKGAS
jgi:hypothetical protein